MPNAADRRNDMLAVIPACPFKVEVFLPVAKSHTRIVSSSLPEAKVCPFGLNATELTGKECPQRVAFVLRVAMSHSLIV